MILTSENYTEQVKDKEGIVVIEFVASYVQECEEQDKILSKLSDEMTDVKFARIDKDEEPELAKYFGINILPSLVIMKDGTVKTKIVGVVPETKIKDEIAY